MNFAAAKLSARRAVHSQMAVPCLYVAPGSNGAGVGYGRDYGLAYGGTGATITLTARLHDRMKLTGDNGNEPGYSNLMVNASVVIFSREELAALGVTLAPGGKVTFPDFNTTGANVSVLLDSRAPYDGPITEKWNVGPAP